MSGNGTTASVPCKVAANPAVDPDKIPPSAALGTAVVDYVGDALVSVDACASARACVVPELLELNTPLLLGKKLPNPGKIALALLAIALSELVPPVNTEPRNCSNDICPVMYWLKALISFDMNVRVALVVYVSAAA